MREEHTQKNTIEYPPETTPRLTYDDINIVPPKKLKPAITGTVVGNFMEWYDFGIYGYLTVTMTAVFTQGLPEQWRLLAMLLGFAVSYLVRPLGGIVLGPLGDRIGRQKVLYGTMAMMAVATALIGLLPTAAAIGGWALVLLYLLKLVQGFSTGGEYAGAATYVAEFAPDKRRSYFTSFLDMGSLLGFAAGAAVVALTNWITTSLAGPGAMEDFGWRIPFLTAIPLGIIAVWVRTRLPETPAFENTREDEDVVEPVEEDQDDPYARLNLSGVIRHHWRALLTGMALVAATNTVGYALTAYMPVYLEEQVGLGSISAAAVTVPVFAATALFLPVVGKATDRFGHKPVYLAAVISALVLLVPAFIIMNRGTVASVTVALLILGFIYALYIAHSAAALPALFPTASRFSGMGLCYNVAVSLFGGTTPLFTQYLLQKTGLDIVPAFYIMFFSLLAGVALFFLPEFSQKPLTGSFPTVETPGEAREVVAHQDTDPNIDVSHMPFPEVREPVNA
ncbi:MFS transporter [Corynebacterium halotolerans]|uniref:Proline/ectoine carrier n=1 Tax=Corynebacterium halotolerans YIM 70093 = DSM 44683 TaxID=1121362 RepID=M1NP68_9CORY|nr:MFS transporter [Corynebacterium halotolerans]AGF73163.1 proline/ectoine carrier [Corynebacterium halotolerans YIM 70093 = DSM 44683]